MASPQIWPCAQGKKQPAPSATGDAQHRPDASPRPTLARPASNGPMAQRPEVKGQHAPDRKSAKRERKAARVSSFMRGPAPPELRAIKGRAARLEIGELVETGPPPGPTARLSPGCASAMARAVACSIRVANLVRVLAQLQGKIPRGMADQIGFAYAVQMRGKRRDPTILAQPAPQSSGCGRRLAAPWRHCRHWRWPWNR